MKKQTLWSSISFIPVIAALIAALLLGAADAGAAEGSWTDFKAASYAGGDGSAGNPYRISTAGQLAFLADLANSDDGYSSGKYFVLEADIDLAPHYWVPATQFRGSFDGRGYKILNLTIDNSSVDYQGLFGQINSGAAISNVGLVNCTITGGTYNGALAGYASTATITGSYSTGVINGYGGNGGLVGAADTALTLSYSWSSCAVTARATSDRAWSGGLVGPLWGGTTTISNCFATGTVTGWENTGGLVGIAYHTGSLTVSNSYSTGEVITQRTNHWWGNVGGLLGACSSSVSIVNSYHSGAVTMMYPPDNAGKTGGIVGGNDGYPLNVSNSYYNSANAPGQGGGTAMAAADMKAAAFVALLNGSQSPAPWQADMGKSNNGFPILADMPGMINFISRTGMPLTTWIVSNSVTVNFIAGSAAIGVSGGEYSVSTDAGNNWGGWTASPGTVNANDQVRVRQISSASNATLTTATLTIGGVSGAFTVTTAAAGDPNASGLVAWWKAENNGLDSVGGNHGAPQNGVDFAAGQVGQAFNLDGDNDFVLVPNSSLWNFGSNDFTIDLRVKFDQTKDNFLIAHDDGAGNQNKWAFYAGNGFLNFHLNSPETGPISIGYGLIPFSYEIGQWYHLAVTRNGSTYAFYVNGDPVGTVTDTHVIPDASAPLTIGQGEGTHYVHGSMDEIKIYNRALSSTEIAKINGLVPDAFSFTPQTGMPLSTSIVSNPVTVTGITVPTNISIIGGEYSVSLDNGTTWGDWTNVAGKINVNNQVRVRRTSSAINSTLTTATLTIGGVNGSFNLTTAAVDDPNASGLVAWWKAENNGLESVGGNHGEPQNGANYAAGKVGQAFAFDGSNDYLAIPHSDILNPAPQQTLAFWIKFDALPGVYRDIFQKGIGSEKTQYYVRTNDANGLDVISCITSRCYGFAEGYDTSLSYAALGITAGNWYHIAFVVNDAEQTSSVYVNGVQKGVSPGYPVSYSPNTSPLTLGGSSWDGYFPGALDEMKIFNRALSPKEVLKLAHPNGPVSWWRGEDSANDSIGNNNGTWQGTPTYGPGIDGKALVFDGVDSYVQVSAQSGSLDVSSGHSLDVWIKLDGYPTTAAYILNKWASGVEDKLLVVLPDGRVGYYLHNAFGGSGVVSSTKLVIGSWYHLAATYDGSEARLYINSSLDAVKGAPGAVSNGNGALYLGFNPQRNSTEPHDHLKGSVDEIRWYNRALSASEVAGSYGLVSWWKGEDNASDSVGNNHGTAMNGAAYGDGTAGRAFSLNGVDGNYVSIPDTSSLRISGDVTVSAYIKRSGLSNGAEGGIITKGASMVNGVDVPSNYFLEIDGSDHLVAGFERADGTNAILAGPALTDLSSFHHVVYVRQGASHSLYLDGAQVVTESFTGVPGDTTGLELTIGAIRESAQYSYVFKGLIDEVKIFSRALSVVEISRLAGTLPAPFIFNPVTDAPLSASLVSNAVTVAGISSPAPIAIAGGGTYRINSGECTATSGTINPGDTVALCLTSAATYAATTSATLTIGGVTGAFTVTTAPDLIINPVTTPTSLVSPTISGTVKIGAAVSVSVNGGSSRSASVTGTSWSYTLTGLVRGNNDITVSAADTGYAPEKSATIECSAPQLTVNVTATSGISGSGGGTVTSDPSSIACTFGPCAALFDGGSTVPLMATPDVNSLFASWSGVCGGTDASCNVLMDGDKGAVASFTYVEPARVETTGLDYPHIRDAYAALSADGTILARQFQFDGGFTLDQGWKLLLKGGYNAAYSENSGFSTIAGALTVKHGRLTVERVLVQ